jgi:hypothetical protein
MFQFFFNFFFLPEHEVSRLPAGGGNAFTHERVSPDSVGLWPHVTPYPLKPPPSSSLTLKGPPCRSAGFGSGTGHETHDPPTYAPSVAVCLFKLGLRPP